MTTATAQALDGTPRSAVRRRRVAVVVTTYVLLAGALGAAIWGGIELRRWAWDAAEPIRFHGDIRNGFRQGQWALDVGYLHVYDQLLERHGTDGRFGLDYPPLRLLVMTQWVGWLEAQEPGIERWRNEYALTWPLLRLNLAMELAAVAAIFLLVRLWVRRQGDALGEPRELRAAGLGALAALLLWFNPPLILDAHAWPQWDAWALPFFLWALLMASLGRFGLAGGILAVGAMLKGQLLIVAPVLLLIPLLRGRFAAVGRMILGFAVGVVACTVPWLAPDAPAIKLAGGVAGLIALPVWALTRRGLRSPRVQLTTAAALVAGVLLAAGLLGGSFAWCHVGFGYAVRSHDRLAMGPVANLATLLGRGWGWRLESPIHLPLLNMSIELRTLLGLSYAATVAWCGWLAARCAAERRTVFLMAATLPWITMFTFMPQMHERYLVWGAACSAAWVALGVGPALLHLLISGQAFMMILRAMIGRRRDELPALRNALDGAIPDIAWALLVIVGVLLWWVTAHGLRGGKMTA
jgi:hypothetical protein